MSSTPSRAKTRVREARLAMYREILLDVAEEVFAIHSYDATRVQQIAEAAGVSLATLYGVFPSKWELFRAVHQRRGAQLLEAAVKDLDLTRASPVDLVLQGTAASSRFHMANPNYLRMSLRQGHAWAVGGGLRSQEEVATWERGVAMMELVFRRGLEEGLFLPGDPPELMARTLMAVHQVRLAAWADAGGEADPDATIQEMHRQLLRLFCPPEVAARYLAPDPEESS